MQRFLMTLVGTRALLMHNSRLANPLDPVKQRLSELTGKKSKTIIDHGDIAHTEFLGGVYFSSELGPCIPADNILAALIEGGRFQKKGAAIERGLMLDEEEYGLLYDGPRTLPELWDTKHVAEDGETVRTYVLMKMVVVQRSRTLRTRPRFPRWGLRVTGKFDESQVELKDIEMAARDAGLWVGLGDGRPRYGRFAASVQAIEEGNDA